eukprot:TRINITY_DN23097_c0_g1_i1.p1 TRINITY_DN23097_c0_g1~~TRINITY_DN23097_c0_g1_i1.p1  ORF type:complete len:226 (-),score=34.36 TRINITY_DN23097_c0_g1_i1:494-1171(-)
MTGALLAAHLRNVLFAEGKIGGFTAVVFAASNVIWFRDGYENLIRNHSMLVGPMERSKFCGINDRNRTDGWKQWLRHHPGEHWTWRKCFESPKPVDGFFGRMLARGRSAREYWYHSGHESMFVSMETVREFLIELERLKVSWSSMAAIRCVLEEYWLQSFDLALNLDKVVKALELQNCSAPIGLDLSPHDDVAPVLFGTPNYGNWDRKSRQHYLSVDSFDYKVAR